MMCTLEMNTGNEQGLIGFHIYKMISSHYMLTLKDDFFPIYDSLEEGVYEKIKIIYLKRTE